MLQKTGFEIRFDPLAIEHFDRIDPKYDSLLQRVIETKLVYEPMLETRNRKRLLRDTAIGATWEIRCGPNNRFRILYQVDVEERVVLIVAVLTKIGNALFAGTERFEL